MDKPIKRDSFEVMEESGYSAIKGAAGGVVFSFLAGAATAVLVAVTAAAIVGGIFLDGGMTAGVLGMITGKGGGLLALAAVSSGLAASIGFGGLAAAGGALFGLAKGASKAERENAAYNAKVRNKLAGKDAEMAEVHNQAMTLGYQTAIQQLKPQVEQYGQQAFEAGKQSVLAELQQHAAAEHSAPHKSHNDHKPHEHHHDHAHAAHSSDDKSAKSFAAAESNRRATAAAAGATLGVG